MKVRYFGWVVLLLLVSCTFPPAVQVATPVSTNVPGATDESVALRTRTIVTAVPSAAPVSTQARGAPVVSTPTPSASVPITPVAPTATLTPTPPSTPATVIGYAGYRVKDGDTLASIAAAAGSTPDLIRSYNRLTDEPQPGRELIIPRLTDTPFADNPAMIIVRGNTTKPYVGLTFDCGMEQDGTEAIMAALRDAGARTTWFVMGYSARLRPDLLRQLVADGHELANHSDSHANYLNIDDAAIIDELARTEATVQELAPSSTTRPLSRPPYGYYDERVLRVTTAAGYLTIYWTLDALDTVGPTKSPEFIVRRLTKGLPAEELRGAIILAHCKPETAAALPEILATYRSMGLEVRPVSDLLER